MITFKFTPLAFKFGACLQLWLGLQNKNNRKMGRFYSLNPHFLKAPIKITRKINELREVGAQRGAFLYIYIYYFLYLRSKLPLKKIYKYSNSKAPKAPKSKKR